MATTEEGTHICADGTKLYTKTWKPTSPISAKILFIHGFSDHCNAYNGLFPTLAGRGILVHAFDQRGWGRSVTKVAERGLTGPTSQVLDDISSVLKGQLPTNVPLFLMGHSMGGGQVLHYAARGPSDIRSQISGYLCESPLVAIHEDTQPSRLLVLAGRLASRVVPSLQMVRRIERSYLCRDEEMCKAYEADDLCHDTGTLEGLAGMLRRAEELDQGKVLLNDVEGCRLWVGHGTEDRVTSFKATARFMDRLQINDKTFRVYDRHYHKLHDEPGEDKIKFANDVADWILARSSSPHIMTVVPNETASKL